MVLDALLPRTPSGSWAAVVTGCQPAMAESNGRDNPERKRPGPSRVVSQASQPGMDAFLVISRTAPSALPGLARELGLPVVTGERDAPEQGHGCSTGRSSLTRCGPRWCIDGPPVPLLARVGRSLAVEQ